MEKTAVALQLHDLDAVEVASPSTEGLNWQLQVYSTREQHSSNCFAVSRPFQCAQTFALLISAETRSSFDGCPSTILPRNVDMFEGRTFLVQDQKPFQIPGDHMASYPVRAPPPNRPDEMPRVQRQAPRILVPTSGLQRNPSNKAVRRETDIAHLSGEMDAQNVGPGVHRARAIPTAAGSRRAPSLGAVTSPVERPRGIRSTSFGFVHSSALPTAGTPEIPNRQQSRNVLRRKESSIGKDANTRKSPREMSASPNAYFAPSSAEKFPNLALFSKSVSTVNSPVRTGSPQIIPELDRYRIRTPQAQYRAHKLPAEVPKLATEDLPPPTPLSSNHNRLSSYSGYSAGSSARFTDSPGPSAFSRDTTPTSMSSVSPGVLQIPKGTPRLRQPSPINSRPPVTRRRAGSTPLEAEPISIDPQGLPSLRESVTSSSSGSTVKANNEKTEISSNGKKKKKRLSPLPPSPPPRKSSQKFKRSQDSTSSAKSADSSAGLSMTSPTSSRPPSSYTPQPLLPRPTPPPRPSREGAPSLPADFGVSPTIIQSNLSSLSISSDKRRSFQSNRKKSIESPSSQLHVTIPTQPPFRGVSRSPAQVQSGILATNALGIVPDLRPREASLSRPSPTTRTPSPGTSKSRFGFFARRTKTAPEVPKIDTTAKGQRKGPAAGTGHEGYGRYAMRGRSSSATNLASTHDRNASVASTSHESFGTSPTAHDPFYLERMSPVVIAGGGGIVENRNPGSTLLRTESNQSLAQTRPVLASQASYPSRLPSEEVSRSRLWPSALPKQEVTPQPIDLRVTEAFGLHETNEDAARQKPSLAFRRSMHRLKLSETETPKLPQPINIPTRGMSPSITSHDTTIFSDDSRAESSTTVEPQRAKSRPRKLSKTPKSPRAWNPFSRSQTRLDQGASDESSVPVVLCVGRPESPPPIAHYALMDWPDEEKVELADIENILQEAALDSPVETKRPDLAQQDPFPRPMENAYNSISPDPLKIMMPPVASENRGPAEPTKKPHAPKPPPEPIPARPSRLAHVGRIPRVVPARPSQTSPKSFSRPFARVAPTHPIPQLPPIVDRRSIALGASPPRSLNSVEYANESPQATLAENSEPGQGEFFRMAPRQGSQATTSTSSTRTSFQGTIAVIPERGAALCEDEVWIEYDDLIGDEHVKVPPSATSSQGHPFQYENYESKAQSRRQFMVKQSPTIPEHPSSHDRNEQIISMRQALATSSLYSPELSARFKEALNSTATPTTPGSFTEFMAGFQDRSSEAANNSNSDQRRSSSSSKSNSNSDRSRKSLSATAEQFAMSPMSQVNLRVGSMNIAKWLTFSNALFSPAKDDIVQVGGPAKQHSILVIDGLGNGKSFTLTSQTPPS